MHQGKFARQRDFEGGAARLEATIIGGAVQIPVQTLYQRRLGERTIGVVKTGEGSESLRGRRNRRRGTKQSREAGSFPSANRIHNVIFPDPLLLRIDVSPLTLRPQLDSGVWEDREVSGERCIRTMRIVIARTSSNPHADGQSRTKAIMLSCC